MFLLLSYQINQENMKEKKVRLSDSAKLTKQQMKVYMDFLKSFRYKQDAIDLLGISRATVDRIRRFGIANPQTIEKIFAAIENYKKSS